ncbi:hypothetical protein EKD04_004030 [Chloroflexales bacterium ZM16-3]|nr:hypothetical protein [Chloroflexales bacterium ZM16-3]
MGDRVTSAVLPFLSDVLYAALRAAGWEKRGEIVRLVQTLKGGDRPKNAEGEFPGVAVMPRSAWEPWGIFRKPLDGRVQDNLRRWNTGGLRRESDERPFTDVIPSERTPRQERKIADHPSLKPQRFMRQIVCAALPLGKGRILDPFLGAGSTIAAAEAIGYESVGVELDEHYYAIAEKAIPQLAKLYPKLGTGSKSAQAPAVMFDWKEANQTHDTAPTETEIVEQESLVPGQEMIQL